MQARLNQDSPSVVVKVTIFKIYKRIAHNHIVCNVLPIPQVVYKPDCTITKEVKDNVLYLK